MPDLEKKGGKAMSEWEKLEAECKNCQACALSRTRKNVVFGVPAEIITPALIRRLYDIDAALFTHRGELYLEYRS